MKIQIEPHTLERARERGVTASQIEDVIRSGVPAVTGQGRLARVKIYDYHGSWKGQHYDQQMVKVIYVVENNVAITVTVVVYYGRWPEAR